jgi:HEAT repeat protein
LVYKQALRPEENLSLMAVHLINWVGDLDRIEVLSKVALDDQGRSPELRIQAIESMTGGNEWPEKVPPALLKLAEEKDPGVRAAAVRAAAGWRSAETDRLILPLVTDDDEAVVKVALEYLSGSEGEHRAEHFSAFEKALKSRHAGVRRLAAAELGHLESIKAVPRLIPLLDDPDSQVREQARGALAQIKSRYEEKAQWLEWYDRVKPKEK